MTFLRTALIAAVALSLAACQIQPVSQRATTGFSQPILLPIKYEGKERYQLARDWEWEWCGNVEKAPAGLVIDGASVPRFLWIWMPPDGTHRAGSLAHDLAYIGRGKMPSGLEMKRKEADLMFFTLMLRAGVSEKRAGIAYSGVRLGGWKEWNKPYVGPVIIPVQQPVLAQRLRNKTFLTRHIYGN
jgi:hypothetical protein